MRAAFAVVALVGCTALRRDAVEGDSGRTAPDASRVDAGRFDAGRQPDAGLGVDSGTGDAGPFDGGSEACPTPVDCRDPRCDGLTCDDGLMCTSEDRCDRGLCTGAPVSCPSIDCTMQVCEEGVGCVRRGTLGDGATCAMGRCCSGVCTALRDNANCGGCGLMCDEMACTSTGPARCTCNMLCPGGQLCVGGVCSCGTGSECAPGQVCVGNTCFYP